MSQSKKRPVEFKTFRKSTKEEHEKTGKWTHEGRVKGSFHQWGYEMEEGENEVATNSIAIVEDESGQIHTPFASSVKFLDK